MDKVKIKATVNDVKELLDELVAEGKLDGDVAKAMLYEVISRQIEREMKIEEGAS